ncbi:MAG: hypothetical protein ACI4QI_05410, partial [Candidatus Coproplasma sp.]
LITFTTKDLLLLYFYRPATGYGTYTDSDSNTVTYCLEVQYKSTNTEPGVTAYGSYSGKISAVDTLVFPPNKSTNTEPGATAYGSYSGKISAENTLVFPPT